MLATPAVAAPRVLSLDQCADQYVLALSPREAIVGLSTRADDQDSRLRERARGLPKKRVGLETAMAARPQIVVRYWGGEPRLIAALEERGVRVVTIEEANDFAGVRANIRRIAAALGQPAAGRELIVEMDGRLARSRGAWKGARAMYLTPSGVTSGSGTLVDAVMTAAGMRNAETRPSWQTVSLEGLALNPPDAVVLGFFDTFQLAGDSWGMGRHRLLQAAARDKAVASLPGALLSCPYWSAAEAVELLAQSAPKGVAR